MKPATLLILAALVTCTAAAGAEFQVIDVTRHDMRPIVQLNATGADFAGQAFEVDVFIYHSGVTFLAYSAETGGAQRVARAVATPAAMKAFNVALAHGKVGQQTGRCGSAAPDHISTRVMTWYGAKDRQKTIPVGGIYSDCPAAVVEIFDAACDFVWATLGSAPEYCVPND